MTDNLKLELAAQAMRFANNILCEVSQNYISVLPEEARNLLRGILSAMSNAEFSIRKKLMEM